MKQREREEEEERIAREKKNEKEKKLEKEKREEAREREEGRNILHRMRFETNAGGFLSSLFPKHTNNIHTRTTIIVRIVLELLESVNRQRRREREKPFPFGCL